MTHTPIKNWHIVISGFLQNQGTPNGMVGVWNHLHAEHSDEHTVVKLCSWNDNWNHLAEFIWRQIDNNPGALPPVIKIYAYSWGAGWGAMKLAKQLGKRGLYVQIMVLSDPVYRSPLLIMRPVALWPSLNISIPNKVDEVWWFYQTENWPHSHNLKPRSEHTVIHEPVNGERVHQYMDDLPAFHDKCFEVSNS